MSLKDLYNAEYYESGCGANYNEKEIWEEKFSHVADCIINNFNPKTVIEYGCAFGYLVAALRDRGVEAYGVDISEYAISMAREDIKPYLNAQSAAEDLPKSFPEKFDLLVSIEMIEHMYEEDGIATIERMCKYSDTVLISSTPDDITEPTHFNVQFREYWAKQFAKNGFYNNVSHKAEYISPNTICFIKTDNIVRVVEAYEHQLRLNTYELQNALSSKGEVNFISNIYFDIENGYSDKDMQSVMCNSNKININAKIPVNCKKIRFDPIELEGCIIKNIVARTSTDFVEVVNLNGYKLEKFDVFITTDPQYEIDLAENAGDNISIEATIVPISSTSLIEFMNCVKKSQSRSREKEIMNNAKVQDLKMELSDLKIKLIESEKLITNYDTEIAECSKVINSERQQYEIVKNHRDEILRSASWKISAPLRLLSRMLRKIYRLLFRNRFMTLIKKGFSYCRKHGLKQTMRKIKYKILKKSAPAIYSVADTRKVESLKILGVPTDPIKTVNAPISVKRINLVTDTLDSSSLLGGVATALVVATEFAKKFDYELRIITRNTDINPLNYKRTMELLGVNLPEKLSFYSDYERVNKSNYLKMDICEDDVFMATSWWSAQAIAETTVKSRFFYIIQEVESMFYNYGSEHYNCQKIMSSHNIDFIVNSSYLNDYFSENLPNITDNGIYFEPAFPKTLYKKKLKSLNEKKSLFFYSRPNNPRNLFSTGVEILESIIASGVLDTNKWDIFFVGQDTPITTFSNGYTAINKGQLDWAEYASFLSTVDIGLCLMYTPHPSYPPFDIASSGGIVVTNTFMNKQKFPLSDNVIVADLDKDSMIKAFKDAIELANDEEKRTFNYEHNTIPNSWNDTLSDTIDFMGEKI